MRGLNVVLLGDLKFGRTTHSLTRALARAVASTDTTCAGNDSHTAAGEDVAKRALRVTHVAPAVLSMPTKVLELAAADALNTGAVVTRAADTADDAAVCGAACVDASVSVQGVFEQCIAPSLASLSAVLADADVLYVTRVQKERFPTPADFDEYVASCAGAGGAPSSAGAGVGYSITPTLLADSNAKSSLRILHPLPRVTEIAPATDADVDRAAYFRQMRYGMFVRMALIAQALGLEQAVEQLWGQHCC